MYRFQQPDNHLSSGFTKIKAVFLLAGLLLVLCAPLLPSSVTAAELGQLLIRFDRMKISTPTTGTICAKPATASTEVDVQVVFPTGYGLSGTLGNWTVNTTNLSWPSGGTAWLGIGTANNVTGQTVTFPSSDLVVGTLYCFNWTNSAALTIKSSATGTNAGTITTRASGPVAIDSSSYSTASIADDQIVVTATIPQTFNLSVSGNTDPLGILNPGTVASSPTPRNVTVNTNAKNGWYVWAKDLNTGLNSSNAAFTIASTTPGVNSTLTAGTEGYNTGVAGTNGGGTGTITIAAPFVNGVATGGGLDSSLRTVASSGGTALNNILTFTNHVAISGVTPAAVDYTDTITVVGAGLF